MIKCNEVINELEAYRRGETTGEFKTLIASHLDSCNACQKELKALEQLDNLMDAYRVAPTSGNLQAGLNKKLAKLEGAYSTNPDGFSEQEPGTGRFHLSWRRAGLLASAAVVMVAAIIWLANPFNGNNQAEPEMLSNIELLQDMETAQMIDIVQDYELLVSMPEIMDVDLNEE